MLDLVTVENVLQFLGRVPLRGDEVPVFVNATNALHVERQTLMLQAAASPDSAPAKKPSAPK